MKTTEWEKIDELTYKKVDIFEGMASSQSSIYRRTINDKNDNLIEIIHHTSTGYMPPQYYLYKNGQEGENITKYISKSGPNNSLIFDNIAYYQEKIKPIEDLKAEKLAKNKYVAISAIAAVIITIGLYVYFKRKK